MSLLKIHEDTRLSQDACYRESADAMNNRMTQYWLDMNQRNQASMEYQQVRGLYKKDQDGTGKYVNDETALRNGKRCSEKGRVAKTLDTVLFAGPPYMGTGSASMENPDVKSRLLHSEGTHVKKSTAPTCGVYVDRFTPLIPCLAENVQNVEHIIPDHWVRGGMSTRTVVRNVDYLKACGIRG